MAFELFSGKKSHGGPPAVTITKYGNFVINSSAIEGHFQKSRFVHVYWDKEKGTVGLKPLPKKEDMSYRLNLSPKGNVGSISAMAFVRHAGYVIKGTESFPAVWNEKSGMLEFTIMGAKPTPRIKRYPRLPESESESGEA